MEMSTVKTSFAASNFKETFFR
jgi:hypothetical protein